MTTYAICRDYEEGESFPYWSGAQDSDVDYWPCDETLYECWQPDCIEIWTKTNRRKLKKREWWKHESRDSLEMLQVNHKESNVDTQTNKEQK